MNKLLLRTEAIIRSEAPPPPVARLIGFDLISVEQGSVPLIKEGYETSTGTPLDWRLDCREKGRFD